MQGGDCVTFSSRVTNEDSIPIDINRITRPGQKEVYSERERNVDGPIRARREEETEKLGTQFARRGPPLVQKAL